MNLKNFSFLSSRKGSPSTHESIHGIAKLCKYDLPVNLPRKIHYNVHSIYLNELICYVIMLDKPYKLQTMSNTNDCSIKVYNEFDVFSCDIAKGRCLFSYSQLEREEACISNSSSMTSFCLFSRVMD